MRVNRPTGKSSKRKKIADALAREGRIGVKPQCHQNGCTEIGVKTMQINQSAVFKHYCPRHYNRKVNP